MHRKEDTTTTGGPSSRLEKPTIKSWKRHALCDSVLSYERNPWKFEHLAISAVLSLLYHYCYSFVFWQEWQWR